MEPEIRKIIKDKLTLPINEGKDKRCTIKEAIQLHVKEKMVLSLSGVGALSYQLLRDFWNKQPEFTIIVPTIGLQLLAMLKNRFAKKVITSFAGIGYPSPRPCPIVQNANRSGDVTIENWTMRTIPQRLMAGAMGWDFIPTQSLIGSSMEKENKEFFKVIEKPFSKQGKIGLLKALRPDVTLIHGAVADPSGNTILTYPLSGDAFGAWAAQKGVIVCVDKIVSTEYIRKHSHMVRIPSYAVLAVCEVPFGNHPMGLTGHGLPDIESYFPDYDFVLEGNTAAMDEATFAKWFQEWVLDVKDHNEYLSKLDNQRLVYLKGKSEPNAWIPETQAESLKIDFDKPPNDLERLVTTAGKIIGDRCEAKGYKTMLAGIGLPNLAAWLAAYHLKEKGIMVDLIAEVGMYGYLPRTSDPTVFSFHNFHTCKMLTNIETVLGYMVGGSTNQCLGVLGAGQLDPYGNANSTKITDDLFLVGSGGANDIATTNQETIVVMNAGRERQVKKLSYITYPGHKVQTVITDVGVFEKVNGRDTFMLTAYMPSQQNEKETQCVARAKENIEWDLVVAPHLDRLDLPDKELLSLLRLFDPRGYYTGL
jgi:acyl CoA:acetate/3-ketoacid CoA transferase alpha subunit/acyl CoA:acetate/3-ketoacid CoA transferase beta subunit